ncbi:hypothetical protein CRYUN_Cryun33cG0002500 [Craigia yunnanensis]
MSLLISIPTLYPFHLYPHLCMVETIESLGIVQHFRKEITSVLDETYRCWLQGEEEIFLDPATCALAFRILRVNGYDVSSEPLIGSDEEHFFNWLGGYLKDLGAALELFRASQMIIHPDEQVLKKQNSWTSHFLKQELSNSSVCAYKHKKYIIQKVNDALEFPHYASLERLLHRRDIVNYTVDNIRMLKTSYSSSSIGNKDFLRLAVEDFNASQSIYCAELKQLERWVQEKRLDELKFARQKLAYCYFSAASTIFSPALSDARISWAKNGVLTTMVDDFFDVGGSEDELLNLIQLVEKHDVDVSIHHCSEEVEILFSALHSTISEIGEKAIVWQGRNLTTHVYEIRESEEGKLNAVSLRIIHGTHVATEDVNQEMKRLVHDRRTELLRLVLQEHGSVVPRTCKELFWKMSKVLHLFYMKDDGFSSNEMINVVNAVIHDPITLAEH